MGGYGNSGGIREWIGGRFPSPVKVSTTTGTTHPEIALWVELPERLVVGYTIGVPGEIAFPQTLRNAMRKPLVGGPRRPDRVRVSEEPLAAELRATLGAGIQVHVAPTPELAEIAKSLAVALEGKAGAPHEHEGYLRKWAVPASTAGKLFGAARLFYEAAPWKLMLDGQIVRLDIPALGVGEACLSVIGNLGESHGFLIFPSLEGYEAFGAAADLPPGDRRDLGTSFLSLSFERGADIHPAMRREAARHGWPLAGPKAYPVLDSRDRYGNALPLGEREVRIAAACATSFVAFFFKHQDIFRRDTFTPVCESYHDEDDLEVRFTAPYGGAHLFEINDKAGGPGQGALPSQPLKVPRNAPCPCGSGRKYKKCCLPKEARPPQPARDPIHDLDERLVSEMGDYARRRFGRDWILKAQNDFGTPEEKLQLLVPWSIFHVAAQGKPIAAWFLEECGGELSPEERSWLEAQQSAWLTLWEVLETQPGASVTVRDLLTGETRCVREARGSKALVTWDVILGRVADWQGRSVFCGMHPQPLPPREAAGVLRQFRSKLDRRNRVNTERLRDEKTGRFLIALWEEAAQEMIRARSVPPRLYNTDGDEMSLTTDEFIFDPESRAEIEARLAAMEGAEPPEGKDSCYTFYRPGNRMHPSWNNTIVGSARVTNREMIVETNSTKRADNLRLKVEKACGTLVQHHSRKQADPQTLLKESKGKRGAPSALKAPEALEIVREMKERHYKSWPDAPLPALRGKSPKEAVKTPKGRSEVTALLKDLENHERRTDKDAPYDFSRLRQALGISQER